MRDCSILCEIESVTSGPPSPGPVLNEEQVVRGAYDPMHYKGQNIRNSVVKARDLVAGSMSVWRVDAVLGFSEAEAMDKLQKCGPAGNKLKEGISLQVSAIREIRNSNEQRLFCVTDDTVCDVSGGRHEAHAAIGICRCLPDVFREMESTEFTTLRDELVAYIKRRRQLGFAREPKQFRA